ncbi:MAG: hypothetical protein HOC33_00120 [Alphaproteobacteria bacterium]|jgi:hypothetical protein|nr:hypothetical protein [Alphaproteobacteria bacterium]MBT4542219.1 hypothetical protein [Alphaproteobacteria bacterium]MBT5162023.1 hypothetical protein [Alphaproteobacteria bacterium]
MNPNVCPPGQGNGNPGGGNTTVIIEQQPNLAINGAMKVAQRGSSFTSVSATQYTLDRWQLEFNGSPGAVVTVTQSTDAPTGSGLSQSLKIDCTTAEAAVAASESIVLKTTIEAQDLQQLMYGDEANAQPTSLSFWVKSPKAGTQCVALYMDDGSVHNVQEFVVSVANAWEKKQVIFPGYTALAIVDDNGAGLTISFPLVAGTDYQATKEIWETGNDYATSEQQNLLDDTANNFCVTGVKFEVGATATGFVHEGFGVALSKSRRYFERIGEEVGCNFAVLAAPLTTGARGAVLFSEKRIAPTVSVSAAGDFVLTDNAGVDLNVTTFNLGAASTFSVNVTPNVASGLVVGDATRLADDNGGNAYIDFDAEY